jgi:hypothetical protein
VQHRDRDPDRVVLIQPAHQVAQRDRHPGRDARRQRQDLLLARGARQPACPAGEGVLGTIGEAILKKIVDKLIDWVGSALSDYFTRRSQEFITAAANPADGVTIILTLRHSSLMQVIRKALRGDSAGAGLALTRALLTPVDVTLQTVAGFRS